jgi:hypothetical protein
MAHQLIAFLAETQVPDRERLQAALADLGFDLFIHVTYRPFHSSGFLPCVLKGKRAGFEISFDSAGLALARFPRLRPAAGGRDWAISLRYGEDLFDGACALMCAAALANRCEALVYFALDDRVGGAGQLLGEARAALEEAESAPPQPSPTLLPPKKAWWRRW